mmetsp:Transcript_36270/g.71285  ORF Transcript_36270/g.71285 Transcript_36270/m.71285 type:complete len:113 (-) Transcript_36270:365-703(-)
MNQAPEPELRQLNAKTVLSAMDAQFSDLIQYTQKLDQGDGGELVAILSELDHDQIHEKLRLIENYALCLGFEEARAMQKGRILDILGGSEGQGVQGAAPNPPEATVSPSKPS